VASNYGEKKICFLFLYPYVHYAHLHYILPLQTLRAQLYKKQTGARAANKKQTGARAGR